MGNRTRNLEAKEKQSLRQIMLEDPHGKITDYHRRYNWIAKHRNERTIAVSTVQKWRKKWIKAGEIPPAKDNKDLLDSNDTNKWSLDKPWSFGYLSYPECEIAQDAVDVIVKVQRYSLKVRLKNLTIREALWVARLAKGVISRIEDDNDGEVSDEVSDKVKKESINDWKMHNLLSFALRYAQREQICELNPNSKFKDTNDIDMQWVLNTNEQILYQYLGIIPEISSHDLKREEIEQFVKEGGTLSVFDFCSATSCLLFNTYRDVWKKVVDDNNDADTNRFMNYIFDIIDEQDLIYAVILRYLSKGPKWNTLSGKEYLLLFNGIKNMKECADDYDIDDMIESISKDTPINKFIPQDIIPYELLEMVGYEADAKKQENVNHTKSEKGKTR